MAKIKHTTTAVDDIIFELTQSQAFYTLIKETAVMYFTEDPMADVTEDEDDTLDSITDEIINKFERC
jgi:hypothetical protein